MFKLGKKGFVSALFEMEGKFFIIGFIVGLAVGIALAVIDEMGVLSIPFI